MNIIVLLLFIFNNNYEVIEYNNIEGFQWQTNKMFLLPV